MATSSIRSRRTVFLLLLVGAISCHEPLPEDLPSLTRLMNDNNETTSVAATNKVAIVYGRTGLLQSLKDGGPAARTMAAAWLFRFPGDDVQAALLKAVDSSDEVSVRLNALVTLKRIGTASSLPAIDHATHDSDSSVARTAADTARAIRLRGAAR
jgi:HEAT repeat protein